MPLTDDELIYVRTEIGDAEPPTDAELDAAYDRLGESVQAVIAEVLRKRLTNLISQPASFTIPGQYGQSTAANIKALQDKLADIDPLGGGVITVGQIVRDGPDR